MADPRVERLADILVHHSLKVQKGEKVLIDGSDASAPLIKEVYRKVMELGGIPITQVTLPELDRIYYENASEEQLNDISFRHMLMQYIDCYLKIQATHNKKELTGIEPGKMSLRQKAMQPVSEQLMSGKIRWSLTMFPTQAYAQDADMSLEQYENFVYGATNVDYAEMEQRMESAAAKFNQASKVRIVAEGTDITVDIAGRQAVICSGTHNVPDGEFYFSPNHLLTEGTIFFDWPTVYSGREIQGIRLTFKEGRVIEHSAEKGGDLLGQILDTDAGSRYLGELGIGCNFGIAAPTKDILFDEKIGGSIHLALGRAYEAGGKGNESAIHWDMVKGLKNGGEIYLDGVLVQKNGQWL